MPPDEEVIAPPLPYGRGSKRLLSRAREQAACLVRLNSSIVTRLPEEARVKPQSP